MASLLGEAAGTTVFGPTLFRRTTGFLPDLYSRTFTVQNPDKQYTLKVLNDGIKVAAVTLNGNLVLGLDDFAFLDPNHDPDEQLEYEDWISIPQIQRTVTIKQGTNRLTVLLVVGRPGSSLTITITSDTGTDTTAPTITATLSPPPNANGWNNSNVTVTFTCKDDTAVASCPSPVTVSTEGAGQPISGTATDTAGNTASTTVQVSLDKTRPQIAAAAGSSTGPTGWYTEPVSVQYTCSDALSGVEACPPQEVVSTEGTSTITRSVSDRAGNSASASTGPLRIDLTAPSIVASLDPPPNLNGWNNSPVTVHYVCTDAGSGVASCPADALVSTDGAEQTLTRTISDVAGRQSSITSIVNLDQAQPEVLIQLSETPNAEGWFTTPVTAHFECADATSGVEACPADRVSSFEGTQTVSVTIVDRAGNTATATSAPISIDTGAPAVHLPVQPGATLTAGATIPIVVDAANRVPVDSVDFVVDGQLLATDSEPPFEFQFTVPEGVNLLTLSATATDTVGKTNTDTSAVSVVADARTTVTGRTVDRNANAIAGADLQATLHGASAEVFDFDAPLDALPDLTGRVPNRVLTVSSLNLRNPEGVFGADPFGFGTASVSRAMRFTAALRLAGADTYTFRLGLRNGGRLSIAGNVVIDIPFDAGAFREATGVIDLNGGLVDIDIVTFDNGGGEVQLSYARSATGEFKFVPGSDLTPPLAPPFTAVSQADGSFSMANVPTVLGDILVTGSKMIDGRLARGRSAAVPPLAGAATAVGDIVLKSGGRIGYYDLERFRGSPNQVPPILTAGLEAIEIVDLNTADLSAIDVLFAQNPDNGGYTQVFRNNLAKIHAFVANGGTLIFHDRHVDSAESVLPGASGNIVRDFADDSNIQIVDPATLVVNGPGGVLTNASLDGGTSSSHGFTEAGTVPAGAHALLSTGNPAHLVTYAYPFGLGHVVYSTIPLDFYLDGSGSSQVNAGMRIYAANVVAYANDVR